MREFNKTQANYIRQLLVNTFFLFAVAGIASAQNPTVLENQQTGTSAWRLTGTSVSDSVGQIKGYASATSVNKGGSITFYVSVNPAQTFTIDVYRMGWYQGLGGRLMQHIGPLNGVQQATCPTDSTTGMIQCQWTPAYTLTTQTSWTSGIYLALLTNAQNYQNYIVFAVRDDSRTAALLYQQPVTTYQAYNNYPNDNTTGKSLYQFDSYGATTVSGGPQAVKVSFDRPYADAGGGQFLGGYVFEYSFVRWLEMSGYDVTYATDVDTHVNGASLKNYRGILSVGHDEYFSKAKSDAFYAARDAGVNLGFFSSNVSGWQVRYESSSSGVANRVVVCYRDANLDPNTDPTLKTVQWRDPPLNRPEQMLVGVQFVAMVGGTGHGWAPYVVENSGHWIYAGTGFKDGDQVLGIVGYEADTYFPQYPPPNAGGSSYTLLSSSPTGAGGYISNSTAYQALSGAWVFATGNNAWSYALDNYSEQNLVDARIQTTTTNILNRFISPIQPDFHLSVSPAAQSVNPGGTANYSVTMTSMGGFSNSVTLSVTGLPAGATARFSPNPAAGAATLSVVTAASTPVGTSSLTVTGVGGGISHSTTPSTSPALTITKPGVTGWFNSSWMQRKAITINHAKVSGASNLTNFPILVSITDPALSSTAFGGQVAQANGNDILFTASDGVTKLNHELDVYTASTGTIVAWVQIPTLSPTSDTTIYLYYGNAAAVSQQNANAVWDSSYKGVWHFGNGATLSAFDSTSDAYNGLISNAAAAVGEIAGSAGFNGSNAVVNLLPWVETTGSAATISFWVNPNSVASSSAVYGTYGTDPNGSTIMYIDMGEAYCGQTTNIRFFMGGAVCTTSNILASGTWTYVTIAYDGTQPTNLAKVKVYSNGVAQPLSDGGGTIRSTINIIDLRHQIGGFNNRYFNGLVDEVRLSSSVRSPDWIATEYNNQSSPSSFISVGASISSGAPAITGLSPSSATAGSAGFTLTVNGTQFIRGATVRWGATALTTTYVSSAQLKVTVPASLIVNAGTANITVATTAGTSLPAVFTINPRPPTIGNLNPKSAVAGGAGFTLTVTGTNFVTGASVRWGTTALTTTYVSSTQLTAVVPASLIANAGTVNVTVATSGGVSPSSTFTISPAPPAIASLSPGSVTAGGTGFTLVVNGTGFTSSATVKWGTTVLSKTYVNSTQVTASVPASLIATPGTASITITTSTGTSTPVTFVVSAGTPWFNASWTHRKAITMNHAMVSGASALTNFPVLVAITDPNLESAAFGGQVAQSNGNDILFTASDGVSKLNHELEAYTASSGTLLAWVQVPTVSPTSDTTIYMYYGNAAAAAQQNPTGVWDANYKGVWHFGTASQLTANDSTADAYNGTIVNAAAGTGQIGGAGGFNGSSALINVTPPAAANTTSATISFWIKPTDVTSSSAFYATYSGDMNDTSTRMYLDMGEPFCGGSTNIRFIFGGAACTESNILAAGSWTYVTIVFDGTQATNPTKVKIYSNGVAQTVYDGGLSIGSSLNIVDLHHQIGGFNNQYFAGQIDEWRISNSIRSAAWIATEYNNQSAPSTFITVGAQQ